MSTAGSQPFFRDDEVVVDRDGIPHYTGSIPGLMREYRQRVLFAFNNLEGDGKDEAEEARDLAKKKQRFGKRLLDALHGEAYKACEDLMADHEKLREPEGYKHIFAALQTIEKVNIVKRTEAFDKFFDSSQRKRGQPVDLYIRQRKQQWSELQDVAENVQMSEDLRAYFLLKHVGISREDRRTVLLANQSNYTMEGIEKALRTSFYDLHEKERQRDQSGLSKSWGRKGAGRGMRSYAAATSDDTSSWAAISEEVDEDAFEEIATEEAYAVESNADGALETENAEVSDYGASEDDEIFQAYSTYKDSRKKLKDIQMSRGYSKNDGKYQNNAARDQAKQAEKARSRCAACHRLGHWAGDAECPAATRSGPKKVFKGGKSKGSGKGRAGKAYMVGESPTFFSLGDDLEEEEAYCDMVFDDGDSNINDMQQDSGFTETDLRRKTNQTGRTTESGTSGSTPWVKPEESPMVPIPVQDLRVYYVNDLEDACPKYLKEDKLTLRELQALCDKWEVKVSGTKEEVRDRLVRFFAGQAVVQKGYSKLYVQLRERELPSSRDMPLAPRPNYKAPPAALAKAKASTSTASSTPTSGRGYAAGAKDRGKAVTEMMMGNEDCRFFRPTAEHLEETPKKDPKTGIAVPDELEVGKPHAAIVCAFCGRPMVLRRHWSDSSLYFECSDPNCKHFTNYKDGLEMLRASKPAKSEK